jgi:hypothetical protein
MLKFARIIYKIKLLLGLNQASTQVLQVSVSLFHDNELDPTLQQEVWSQHWFVTQKRRIFLLMSTMQANMLQLRPTQMM